MFGIKQEPAVVFKVLEEIVRALIPMALIFGWVQWTEAQTGAVMLFIGVVVGGLSVLFTRSQTVAIATADRQITIAKAADPDTPNATIVAEAAKGTGDGK